MTYSLIKINWQPSLRVQRVDGDNKIINGNKIKTDACSDKNRCRTPTKLLNMDLMSLKMSQNKTSKSEIATYQRKKESKKKKASIIQRQTMLP